MYFDGMDLAVLRTLQHTTEFCDEDSWISLSGPARAWRGIDTENINWDMGPEDDTLISFCLDALQMVFAKEMPSVFNELSYSTQELMVYKPIHISYF